MAPNRPQTLIRLDVSVGSQTRKSGPAILTSVLPTTADIRQRGGHVRKVRTSRLGLLNLGCLGTSETKYQRKTLGQKIRLQPCIRHTGRPRTAGAQQRSNERRSCNGDTADAGWSCPVRSGRYRPSCWRDPYRPRTDDAMPNSNPSRQTIKQVQSSPKLWSDRRAPGPAKHPQSLPALPLGSPVQSQTAVRV